MGKGITGMAAEQIIRLAFFFGVLMVVAVWEVIVPRRPLSDSKGRCWFTNLSHDVFQILMLPEPVKNE